RRRGGVPLGPEVLRDRGPARRRLAWTREQVLVGERHPVERPPETAGLDLGLADARGAERLVGVDAEDRVEPRVQPRDAREAGLDGLDRRALPPPDPRRDAGERLGGHGRAAAPGAASPRGAPASSAATKPAGSSAIARSPAARSIAAARSAAASWRARSGSAGV